MDVLTIQWGWIGGYPTSSPPSPPIVISSMGYGYSYPAPRKKKYEYDDDIIAFLLFELSDDD